MPMSPVINHADLVYNNITSFMSLLAIDHPFTRSPKAASRQVVISHVIDPVALEYSCIYIYIYIYIICIYIYMCVCVCVCIHIYACCYKAFLFHIRNMVGTRLFYPYLSHACCFTCPGTVVKVISSHTVLDMWLRIQTGIEINPC